VLLQDRELEQTLSERDLIDPIAEIEDLYERAKVKGLVSKFDTETAMKLFPEPDTMFAGTLRYSPVAGATIVKE